MEELQPLVEVEANIGATPLTRWWQAG